MIDAFSDDPVDYDRLPGFCVRRDGWFYVLTNKPHQMQSMGWEVYLKRTSRPGLARVRRRKALAEGEFDELYLGRDEPPWHDVPCEDPGEPSS